jgi:hypothetical protein
LLPPKINEEKSTIAPAAIVQGDTLKLYCHADGIPTPKITWYFRKHHHQDLKNLNENNFESSLPIALNSRPHLRSNTHLIQEGDTLIIKNISTYYSGIFECIANNSVPPAASRKIRVNVECKLMN